MKNSSYFLLITCFLFLSQRGVATGSSDDMSYAAYLSGSLSLWERVVAQKQSTFDSERSIETRFDLALSQYGLLSATMKDKNEEVFDKYVDEAVDHLEELADAGFKKAESLALMSAIYGLKIGYTPWKGMFLGPKSSKLIETAIELESQSPIVWKLYGNNKLFTPETWGGDIEQAMKAYQKSIALFEEQGNAENNWLYLDNFAWLGQTFEKMGKSSEAISTYQASLEIENDFNWVKYALLPAISDK